MGKIGPNLLPPLYFESTLQKSKQTRIFLSLNHSLLAAAMASFEASTALPMATSLDSGPSWVWV